MEDLGPCPKCGSGSYFLSGCTACGHLPGMPVRTNPAPASVQPLPREQVRMGLLSTARRLGGPQRPTPGLQEEARTVAKIGRPAKPLDPNKAMALRAQGVSIRGIAVKLGVSVKRVRVALYGPRGASPVPTPAGPKVVLPVDGWCPSCGATGLLPHQRQIFDFLMAEGIAGMTAALARRAAEMVEKVAERG